MHFFSLSSSVSSSYPVVSDLDGGGGSNGSFEFEFSSRASSPGHEIVDAMIRLKNKSLRRRTRSMSPLRNPPFDWNDEDDDGCAGKAKFGEEKEEGVAGSAKKKEEALSSEALPSMSASSFWSSSAGRNSKRWVFFDNSSNKFWATISISPAKDKRPQSLNNASGV